MGERGLVLKKVRVTLNEGQRPGEGVAAAWPPTFRGLAGPQPTQACMLVALSAFLLLRLVLPLLRACSAAPRLQAARALAKQLPLHHAAQGHDGARAAADAREAWDAANE